MKGKALEDLGLLQATLDLCCPRQMVALWLALLGAWRISAFTAPQGNGQHYTQSLTRRYGEVIQVKFRIHADGRVEETVLGVKGSDCQKVTEDLNEKLGSVISSQPTEEMFEQKVAVAENVYETKFSEW